MNLDSLSFALSQISYTGEYIGSWVIGLTTRIFYVNWGMCVLVCHSLWFRTPKNRCESTRPLARPLAHLLLLLTFCSVLHLKATHWMGSTGSVARSLICSLSHFLDRMTILLYNFQGVLDLSVLACACVLVLCVLVACVLFTHSRK